tara:strand:- start:194 stop:502 length:309 start_codon:yes stop_codon:yes gene_type:complete
MSKKTSLKPIAAAIGTTFAVTLAASPVMAADNPFGLSELSSGYMVVADAHEGKSGEGKCGGDKGGEEGSCGGDKGGEEGSCGGDKGGEEGKCGEGKCGGDKG